MPRSEIITKKVRDYKWKIHVFVVENIFPKVEWYVIPARSCLVKI
jgi:hypothetical protein